MLSGISLPVTLIGVGGLVVTARGLIEVLRCRRESVVMAPLTVFALLLVLADSRFADPDVLGGRALIQGSAAGIVLWSACVAFLRRSYPWNRAQRHWSGVLILICATWLVFVDIWVAGVESTVLLGRVLAVAVIASLLVLARASLVTVESVAAILTLVFGVACVATLLVPDAIRACSAFKCGPFGGQVTGPFSNENTFAAIAFLSLVTVFAIKDRRTRWAVVLLAMFVLYAAHSRNAQISAAVGLLSAISWSRRAAPVTPLLWGMRTYIPVLATALGLYLIFTAEREAFSNRGSIWMYGRQAVRDHLFLGQGLDSWSIDVLQRNYMHSEYLMLLYSGGLIALSLFIAAMISLLHRAKEPDDWIMFALPVAFLVNGLVQIPWNPISIESGLLFGLVFLSVTPSEKRFSKASGAPEGALGGGRRDRSSRG